MLFTLPDGKSPVFSSLLVCAMCAAVSADYTLQEVLDVASRQAEDMDIIKQGYTAGMEEVNAYKASVYPQVYFSTGGAYFNNSVKGYGIFGSLLGGADASGGAGGGGGASIDRFKGMEYSMATVLEQPLFTFGRLSVVKRMAKSQTRKLEKQKDLQREQFLIGVVQAYNAAVLAAVETGVTERSLEMADRFHTAMDIDYKGGARPKIDWLQAQALLAQASAEHKMASTRQEVALNRLKNTIGMQENDSLDLSLEDDMYPEALYIPGTNTSEVSSRSTLIKEIDLLLAQDLTKYEKTRLYPSINLNGQVSSQLMQIHEPEGMEGEDQPYDVYNPDFFNYRVGLNFTWTLFDGFRTLSTHRQAWARAKIEERSLAKMKKQDAVQLGEAKKMVTAGGEVVKAATAARDAAVMAYHQAKIDLEAGAINVSQYIDIEKQFEQNQLLYYRARAEELMAHINLKLSMGLDVFQ